MSTLTQNLDALISRFDDNKNETIVVQDARPTNSPGQGMFSNMPDMGMLNRKEGIYALTYFDSESARRYSVTLSPDGMPISGTVHQMPNLAEISARMNELQAENPGQPLTREQLQAVTPQPKPPEDLDEQACQSALAHMLGMFLNNDNIRDDGFPNLPAQLPAANDATPEQPAEPLQEESGISDEGVSPTEPGSSQPPVTLIPGQDAKQEPVAV
jgi:hypothetical protein